MFVLTLFLDPTSFSEKNTGPTGRKGASYYGWMIVPAGFVDIEGPFLSGGSFYRRVAEDGVHLSVLDKDASKVLGWGLRLPLHSSLRG